MCACVCVHVCVCVCVCEEEEEENGSTLSSTCECQPHTSSRPVELWLTCRAKGIHSGYIHVYLALPVMSAVIIQCVMCTVACPTT